MVHLSLLVRISMYVCMHACINECIYVYPRLTSSSVSAKHIICMHVYAHHVCLCCTLACGYGRCYVLLGGQGE